MGKILHKNNPEVSQISKHVDEKMEIKCVYALLTMWTKQAPD